MIRVPEVRLVGDNVEPGVYRTDDALRMAEDLALDLVEISPNAVPSVCRIIDYNKFLYEKEEEGKGNEGQRSQERGERDPLYA